MADLDIAKKAIRLHATWLSINRRCNDVGQISYHRYGGRGIKVEWQDFDSFFTDMYPTFSENLTLDRIDNDGNYSKDNCRWATKLEQANNTSSNVLIEYNGKSQTANQWARELGIHPQTFRQRLYVYKWGIKKIMTTPTRGWSRRTI